MTRLVCPVFDTANHLYKTSETRTKYWPKGRAGAINLAERLGRTKITVDGQISNYDVLTPTFDHVGPPGSRASYFKDGNPEGKSHREIVGRTERAGGVRCVLRIRHF
jgi:hypothetical protein